MLPTKAYAAFAPGSPLGPYELLRREPGEHDVLIDIAFCGVCHSDLHQVRDEWRGGSYPMVPGHEIVGRVARVGSGVRGFAVGDPVGVGCLVDSCRTCPSCQRDLEQFCENGPAWTYNGTLMDRKTQTYGRYSTRIVVDQAFVLRVPSNLDLAGAAPLLCAGITTYSPLRHWHVGKGTRVGVVGLGGLGHMAVKLAAAMGAEVTVLSTSHKKEPDAKRLGARAFAVTTAEGALSRLAGHFDLVVDTLSAEHDYNAYLSTLRVDGAMVLLGIPPQAAPVQAFSLIGGRRSLAGSLIGGIAETQEMLDFCGTHGITSDIELIRMQGIGEAYERMLRGDVRYRFVIDTATL